MPRGQHRRRVAALVVVLAAVAASVDADAIAAAAPESCAERRASAGHTQRVQRVLRAGRDVWGEALLAAPAGPTYAGARRFLPPLLYARAPGKQPLTQSGVYYLPFAQPLGVQGAGSVALHVADGSQVLSNRVGERSLTVYVGRTGRERYGACLARLTPAQLGDGHLPILQTRYVDAAGTRYRQESLAARPPGGGLGSYLRLEVDARRAAAVVRLRSSAGPVRSVRVPRGATRTIYAGWLVHPTRSSTFAVDAAAYDRARAAVGAYWKRRLAEGTEIVVPERRVNDAVRSVLIQNLMLTWRYSIGNPYEQFSFPEGADVAQVLAEYGHGGVSRSILQTSLTRKPTPYANWKRGEKLVASAAHYRLTRDRAYLTRATPELRRYVDALGGQIRRNGSGLLDRERYSSDIPNAVLGLHSQAVVWQGLHAMARVWAETGRAELARGTRSLAVRLRSGLQRAVRSSQVRLSDGSLFLSAQLLDVERPYGSLTEARLGSYWNLVVPYALASGLFRPGSAQSRGALRYLLRHGSRLLGVVRAGAYALYEDPVFPTGGTDAVYGINVARFLADEGESDQLVLSLYGTLAAAMTPDTFVSGEAASVAPLLGRHHRAMYLPPNGASNAAFLETLRALLVHETRGPTGEPAGLQLAPSTPRTWLAPGKRITVSRAATSFGPVSYTLTAGAGEIRATVGVPARRPDRLELHLRLPAGRRIAAVTVDGRPHARFRGERIDLSGLGGSHELVVRTRGRGARRVAAVQRTSASTRRIVIRYRAHDGRRSRAVVLVPSSYRRGSSPPLPLIISPHGRGLSGSVNATNWGNLPSRGGFAVVNPDARGRKLSGHSWGFARHVDDLARMPEILRRTLPWLRIDPQRIYAFGGSMGGQETLLLVARHPRLLAGAAAFDAVTDFALQYRNFRRLSCSRKCLRAWGMPLGDGLRKLARRETGGTPRSAPRAYAARSPLAHVRAIAGSCVPLQLWWSAADRVVVDQARQSARLFWELRRLNPAAPVEAYVGFWIHSREMRATTRLPLALSAFGLLAEPVSGDGLRWIPHFSLEPCTRLPARSVRR